MSSADTYVFTSTSVFLQDFVLRNRQISKKMMVRYFRIAMVFLVLGGAIFGYLLRSIIISTYLWVTLGIILGTGVLASWIFKKISGLALSLGFSFGFLVFIYIVATNTFTPMVIGYCLISNIVGLILGSIISVFIKRKKGK